MSPHPKVTGVTLAFKVPQVTSESVSDSTAPRQKMLDIHQCLE
jgi:hypothetical protein